ncbi:MAG: hypothetical protein NTU73_14730 [Ignavibacteriae bacterium]|nr:hypothetical protein [Ignavibacteriota bacterium]
MLNIVNTSYPKEQKKFLKCNGNSYDVTNNSGLGLVEKLQAIARDNGISRFDIYDGENISLSPADIENGNFSGDLSLKIENLNLDLQN